MPDCPAPDGSSPRQTSFDGPPPMCIDPSKSYTATMDTSLGEMVIHLDAAGAPKTVNNFVFLARYHYYDSLVFHFHFKEGLRWVADHYYRSMTYREYSEGRREELLSSGVDIDLGR